MHDAGDLLVLADVQDAREIGAVHLVHTQVIVGICSQGVGQLPHSPLRDHAALAQIQQGPVACAPGRVERGRAQAAAVDSTAMVLSARQSVGGTQPGASASSRKACSPPIPVS